MARASSEALEPRLLYSADPLGAAAAWDGSAQAWQAAAVQASGDALAETQPLRVIVVDHRVRDVHDLVAGLLQGAPAGERWELLELNAHSDGLQQLSTWLEGRRDVAAVHLLAHGEDGALWLGAGRVDAQALRVQAAAVQAWSEALRSDADILLYGCDVAATDLGLQFVAQWAALSGADVAASRNSTGQGGDWSLEVQMGVVEAPTLAAPQWSGQLALTPQGGETRVNTTTDGAQVLIWSNRQVAMDADGNVVVVWEDQSGLDGNGSGVFAQRYDANGAPVGGQFRVNSVTAGNQANPEVAMDINGNFVVVWNSTGQDGDGDGVYAQRFNASGVPQGIEFRVNQTTADDQMAPAVAMDAAGNFVVTWESRNQDASGWGVYRRHFSALGVSLSGELLVPGSTNGNQREPAIAMDSSGNFVIAWTDEVLDGSPNGVYAQRYNASGTPQGGQFQINVTTADDQGYPQLAMDASGFVIAWESNLQDGSEYALIGRRYNAAGVAQGGEVQLNSTTTGTQWNANVALAPGGFLASWTSIGQDGDVEGVYVRQFALDGTPLSPEVRLNSTIAGAQDNASLAANAQGQVAVVWSGNGTGDPTGIFLQRFTADAPGISVSTAGPLATTEAGGQDSFTVVLDSAPTADVSIAISVSRTLEATLSTSLLTFTPGNWSTPQTVTVTGLDDALADGNRGYAVVLGPASSADSLYNGLNPTDVSGVNAGTDTFNTVTVNTSSDTLDGNTSSLYALVENPGADGVISLREALTAANNTPNGSGGVDRINFAIPGTGIHVITPLVALPAISDGLRLDGRTDTSFAANGNRPAIVLDGNNLAADGLSFVAGSDNSEVRGLVIRDFAGDGIELHSGTASITVAGNYLGRLAPDGSDVGPGQGNDDGLRVSGTGHTIGGGLLGDGNIISGNAFDGAVMHGTGHIVQGNWVGTSPSGATGLGNGQDGLSPTATATLIGGVLAGQGNVIAHNQGMGLDIWGGGTGIAILGNRIEGNGNRGIDLNADGVTPNDPGDADTGQNGLQNFPVLFSAATSGANTTVIGTFNSQPGTAYRIEFFSTPAGDATGHGEGSAYLGFVNVVTDGSGNMPINTTLSGVPVTPGHAVTATATVDLGGGQFGSTSEFSQNVTATLGGRMLAGSVLEDVDGDGQVLDDGQGLANAAVTLYLDDGDNTLDAGDTLAASVVADAAGRYSASNLAAGTYWVVADSRSLVSGAGLNPGSAAADTWAEQTYGAAGSVAWNGSAYAFTATAGTFYGGQRLDRGDDAAGLLSAEHVIRVDVSGGDATAVDFGFSFNAITHSRDGDEVAGGNRSIQGSLRQFIQNSNALPGMQSSQFRIASTDPSWLAGRAVISLASALPAATDALRLDATTQTLWGGNTNAGDFSIASSTGTQGRALPPVQRPEVEIRGAPGSPSILDLQGSGSHLSGFALLRTGVANNSSHAAVRVMADGALITGNVFGATAISLGDPLAVGRVQAVGIRLLGSADVSNNIFAHTLMHAISAEAGADGFSIVDNHIAFPAVTGNTQAGVAVRDVTGGLIQGNAILSSGGNAIELYVNADNVTIDANSLLGSGALPGGEDSAVDILAGSDNNLLTRNLIAGSVGNGVFISASQGNTVGQAGQGNQITGNGGNGIYVTNANGTRIRGNHIGTDASGTLVDGQAFNGVDISSGATNTMLGGVGPGEGNRIAHNGMDGISLDNAAGIGHALLGNQLWGNGSLGIDLNDDEIINPLDPLDADTGPNGLQNHPLITSATRAGGSLAIEGSLHAQPFTNYRIELMTLSPAQADPSGHGEGALFLTAVDVITDAAGDARFSVANLVSAVPAGHGVTATATVITGMAAFGSTSEFAPNAGIVAVNSAPVLDNTGAMVLTSIDEDAVNNPGQTVASIIASAGGDRITDVDPGALEGIAVTGWASSATQSPGRFEFSLDGGLQWQLLPELGTSGANLVLLLRSTDLIRFVPQGVDAEAVTLSFRAWDASSGNAGDVVSVASTGGSSAFSAATETANLTVTAVNDVPIITSNGAGAVASISLPEGNTAVTRVTAADADGPGLSYVLAGGADRALFAVQPTTGDLAFLNPTRFAGRASANGDNVYEVVVQADDGAGGTDTQTLQVTVTAVTHTVIVSTTADDALANDGDTRSVQALLLNPGSDGRISLREALLATNATPNGSGGADRIVFDIAAPMVAGTHRVALTQPLPTVTDALLLDASTEPDALATGAPVVVLDGSAFSGSGLVLAPAASGSLVRGMAMEGFAQAALWLQPGVNGTRLEANWLAGNGVGIWASGSLPSTNAFLGNRIWASAVTGIRLGDAGAGPNDAGDADSGPNGLQNHPVLERAAWDGLELVLRGQLQAAPNTAYRLEFFANPAGIVVASGAGQYPLQTVDVSTDASGLASFSPTIAGLPGLSVGDTITATATRLSGTGVELATSEFSATRAITPANSAPVLLLPDMGITPEDTSLALPGVQLDDIDLNVATVSLAAAEGRLSLDLAGGAQVVAGALGGSAVSLQGSQAQLNAALATLRYQPRADFSGADRLQVIATDAGGLIAAGEIPVTLLPVNDAPVLTAPLAPALAAEDALFTWTLPAGVVTDADAGDTLTLTIVDAPAWLRLNLSVSGAMGVQGTPADRDVGRATVILRVIDSAGASVDLPWSVEVSNTNDNPTGSPQVVGTALEGSPLTLDLSSIADGDGLGNVSVQWLRNGLELLGANALTLTPGEDDQSARFSVVVRWTDARGTAESLTSLPSDPVAERNDAPTITHAGGADTADLLVPENTVDVAVISASDPDRPLQRLQFSLLDGQDAAWFALDPDTGVLRLRQPADHETPQDTDANNRYALTIRVSDDAGAVDEQVLNVRIGNVNEAPTLALPERWTVLQGAAAGTSVGAVTASDTDANDALRFRLTDDAAGRFVIDARTGAISVAEGARFDATAAREHALVVQVQDTAGLSASQTALVTVLAVPGGLGNPSLPGVPPADPGGLPGNLAGVPPPASPPPSPVVPSPPPPSPTDAGREPSGTPAGAPPSREPGSEPSSDPADPKALQAPGASNLGRTVGQGPAPTAGQRVGQLLGGWGLVAWVGDGVADAVTGRDGLVQREALLRAGTDAGPASSVAGAASASLDLLTGAVGWLGTSSAATPLELTRALLQEGLELRSEGTDGVASMLGRLWVAGAREGSGASASADDILAPPREADERTPAEEWLIEVTQPEKVMGVSLTAGLVWWVTRGGGVIASALMGVPAWRQIDLLPVMLAAE